MGRNTDNAVKLYYEAMEEPNSVKDIMSNTLLGINMNLAIIADCMEENKLLNETLDDVDKSLKRIALKMDVGKQEKMDVVKKDVKKSANSDKPKSEDKPKSRECKSYPWRNRIEKHKKIFALRRAGWSWEQVADVFSDSTPKQLMNSHNGYLRRHPDLVKQWEG